MNFLSLKENLKRIIGEVWYIKDNFESIIKNKILMKRAESIQDIIRVMANYHPEKAEFADRLVLNNYIGSIQRYLTGYDLASIHLSSKSLEIAFLLKIGTPRKGERCWSLGDLCTTIIERGLITQRETIESAWHVVNRRNMTMHDAILEQAILWVYTDWLKQKQEEIPKEYHNLIKIMIKPLMSKIQKRVKEFDSLPNLRWYVSDKSFESTKNLIIDFLEKTIGKTLFPLKSAEGKGIKAFLSKIPEVIKDAKETARYETDFIKYSVKENLKDVKIVLEELYNQKLFKF